MAQRSISQQVLQQARLGNLDALREVGRTVTPRNLSVDVLNILFEHVTSNAVPNVDTSRRIHVASAVTAARPTISLRALWKIISTSEQLRKPDVEAVLLQKIIEAGDAILDWSKFSLQTGLLCFEEDMLSESQPSRLEQYLLQADLLLELIRYNRGCFDTLASSSAFSDLFFELWTAENRESRPDALPRRMLFAGSSRACPIIELASMILTNSTSRDDFLSQCNDAQRCDDFCRAILDRVDYGWEGPMDSQGRGDSLDMLIGATACLVCTNRLFCRRLTRLQYLNKFCARFYKVMEAARTRKVPLYFVRGLVLFLTLAANATSSSQLCKNWEQLHSGKYLQMLFQATAALTSEDQEARDIILKAVGMVCDAMSYPKLFGGSTFGDPWPSVRALEGNTKALYAWKRLLSLQDRARQACTRLETRPKVFMCDYQKCGLSGISSTQMVKECAGCSSAVYCSQKCQERDWEDLHRDECAHAQKSHSAQMESQIFNYDHEARASHVALLEVIYSGMRLQEDFNQGQITVIDCISVRDRAEYNISAENLSKVQAEWEPLPQTYLNVRLRALFASYRSGSFPSGWRLVEGIFPPFTVAHKVIRLITLLKPVEGGYTGVYCVARLCKPL